jgi:hypothetical protein
LCRAQKPKEPPPCGGGSSTGLLTCEIPGQSVGSTPSSWLAISIPCCSYAGKVRVAVRDEKRCARVAPRCPDGSPIAST